MRNNNLGKSKMMNLETINVEGDYLDLEDLPHNCIFNKVKTGCGGTTIALRNEENYVIAVPYTELIINKLGITKAGETEWSFGNGDDKVTHQAFGLFGNFCDCKTAFQSYVTTEKVKKIICTYDKIPLLEQFMHLTEYRLLVDEFQQLLKAYAYRAKAIDGVINTFKKFKSFCFMSATPIHLDFRPRELADIEEVTAMWDKPERLHIELVETDKPYLKVANLINKYKNQGYIEVGGVRSEEAFFFINSVSDIASILAYCQLSPEDVKIVCADKEANKQKLSGYEIENSRTPAKKFTFCTCKSFEGVDFFSPTGIAFIVSSGSNKYTMLDIETDIPQIAGRLRNTCFKNLVVHFVNPKHFIHYDMPYKLYQKRQQEDIDATKEFVDWFNGKPEKYRLCIGNLIKLNKDYVQINDTDNTYLFNDRLPKLEMYNYKIYQEIYKNCNSLIKSYQKQDNDVCSYKYQHIEEDIENACHIPSFKEVYLIYSQFKKEHPNIGIVSDEINSMLSLQPLVKDAYNKLGDKKVASLRYTKCKIEDALDAIDDSKDQYNKIASILSRKLEQGFISSEELKKILQDAYNTVGMNESATAKDIKKWYETLERTRSINGVKKRGHVIVKPLFILLDAA